jgi:hypothetical protein
MTNEVVRGYWASVYCNDDFICVKTNSGYRGGTDIDPKGSQNFIPGDASDENIGLAVVAALMHSRWVLRAPREGSTYPPEVEFDSELNFEKGMERYAEWVEFLMSSYNYKTKKALFKNMKNCSIEKKSGCITFKPSYHEKLEAWSGTGEDVVIADPSTIVEVGAALRMALNRCIG